LEFYVEGNRSMSMDATGGTLHGSWIADNQITTSDRRLKDNIKPIQHTLDQNYMANLITPEVPRDPFNGADQTSFEGFDEDNATAVDQDGSSMRWVLRQLRPVSFNFKIGDEAKQVRFGFIADEMETVLPQVVRSFPGPNDGKEKPKQGIAYGDLIAVLTGIVKHFGSELQAMEARVRFAETELERLDEKDPVNF